MIGPFFNQSSFFSTSFNSVQMLKCFCHFSTPRHMGQNLQILADGEEIRTYPKSWNKTHTSAILLSIYGRKLVKFQKYMKIIS